MAVSLSLLAGAGWQFLDDNANPLTGGLLYTYAAGTTTPLATYTSSSGSTPNTNPIVLDAAGRVSQEVWLTTGSDYKFILKNSTGVTIWTKDDIPGGTSSDDVTFLQAGTGAVERTAQAKMRDVVSVKDFGAVGDGVINDSAAIQNAIASLTNGGTVEFPPGQYKCGSALTVPNYVVLHGSGRFNTKLLRAFTGNFMTLGGYCGIENLTIDGQQATYGSGKGIVMSGVSPVSYAQNIEVTNFSQACLEFGADAGATFRAIGSTFYTTGTPGVQAAIVVNGTDTAATSRHFIGCESAGCTLFNFGGCNDLYVTGGYTNGLIFGAASSKVMLNNMRVGFGTGTVTIAGGSHRIRNSVFAGPVTLTCTNTTFHCEVPGYDITDNGTGNDVYIATKAYTPIWTASGGGAAIGNGSIVGSWSRQGTLVNFQIDMTLGSTSTVGSGDWRFSLPVPDYALGTVQMCGVGFAQNAASSASTVFAVRVDPGQQRVTGFYGAGGTGAPAVVGATSPAAVWGALSVVRLSGQYYVP